MACTLRLCCVFVLFFGASSFLMGQPGGTGIYSFGSFDNRVFDSINIGNLNVHFSIPVFSKPGRGIQFSYNLGYDSLIWSATGASGVNAWTPSQSFGWLADTAVITGYATYEVEADPEVYRTSQNGHQVSIDCTNYIYQPFVYVDAVGVSHTFTGTGSSQTADNRNCHGQTGANRPNLTAMASDGSGYKITVTNYTDIVITDARGSSFVPPVNTTGGSGNVTDTNGNQISTDGSGVFTDTLGTHALTIAGSGSASSPRTFTYPVTLQADGAATATATQYYRTYTVQTNFSCPGIAEYGANGVDLLDHITLANGGVYSFSYEVTPAMSGSVTGRLASVTLPTGGTINYTYSGGCNGSGINADGTVGSLTRTTTDGTRSYNRSPINSNATATILQDEKNNQTLYQFTIVGGSFYETHRQIYQGAMGGSNLLDQFTCYNGARPNCDGAAIALPISSTVVINNYNNGSPMEIDNTYSANGLLTSSAIKNSSSNLESMLVSYNALAEVASVLVRDSSNNTISSSNYGYDEGSPTFTSGIPQHLAVTGARGNLTSASSNGSGVIDTTMTYYDTGAPISTTTPNGTTHYSYDSTQTFVTSTTLPTPLSGVELATSASYDQQTGALISATGMNAGQITQIAQYERLLRPSLVSLPNGGQVQINYESPNQIGRYQPMGNGTAAGIETLVDGYSRPSRVAVANGQSSNPWYQTDYCYDAAGLLQFQSVQYQGDGWGTPKRCSGNGTSYVYDALGRVTSLTTPDGTTQYQYNGRAEKITDVNGVQRITQYDLLGRISSVCEISSNSSMPGSGSPVVCGMDISGTGFLTSYSYDLAAHSTTITQGAQLRVITTDSAGRIIQMVEPERGTTNYSYSYNSAGLVVTRKRPRANQINPAVLTTTTTQLDSLSRLRSITSDDGITPSRYFGFDAPAGWVEGQSNVKGMLSYAQGGSNPNQATSIYSYDLMGQPTQLYQCLPSGCGNATQDHGVTATYDLVGNLTSETDGATGGIVYSRSPAGEVTSITNLNYTDSYNPPNLVSNVVNGPNGPISYTLGNGLNIYKAYDTSGRFFAQWVCSGPAQFNCGGQLYGTDAYRSGDRVTAMDDTVLGASRWFGYDEFDRLTSSIRINNGDQSNFSYTYDRYGNRWAQTVTQGSGPQPNLSFDPATNRISSTGYSYDAAGNLTFDGQHTYQYDAEGNVLTMDGGNTAQYTYDAMNRRAREQTANSTFEYVFDFAGKHVSRWNVLLNSFGDEGRIYWDGKPLAVRAFNGQTFFEHQDVLGTERMRTNYQGQVAEADNSLSFGDGYSTNVLLPYADQDNRHFALLDYDSASNTDHARFRQYSPTQGRWMSPDPYDGTYDSLEPQSFNRYSYVMNRPLSAVDPLGLALNCITLTFTVNGEFNGTETNCIDSGSGPGGGPGGGSGSKGGASAPNNTGKPCSVGQRAQLLGSGVLNLALAAGKFTGAAGVEVGSSGIGTALALYGVYSGAGNLTSGLIQTVGAFSSNPSLFQQAASVSSAVGSVAGLTTLFATNGNLTAASNAARFENFGLFGLKGGLGGSFNPLSATGTAVNAAKQVGIPIGCH